LEQLKDAKLELGNCLRKTSWWDKGTTCIGMDMLDLTIYIYMYTYIYIWSTNQKYWCSFLQKQKLKKQVLCWVFCVLF
jgi:hypothetical protein